MESVATISLRATKRARREPALAVPKFAPWGTVFIGGAYAAKLQKKVFTDNISMSKVALMVVQNNLLDVQEPTQEIATIRLSPNDFGQRKMSLSELINPDRLAMWSEQNASLLPEDHVIDILPAQVGPYIWSQFPNQYDLEHLLIAMAPIEVPHRKPFIFRLMRQSSNGLCLSARGAAPHVCFKLQTPFLFRLRPRKAV
ncbi:MAG: hypothetical protein Q7T37_00135 [bacterium]|nr:hypothetical protein [bacterium]MDO8742729.1 hypothetical protein [bacterium]